MLGFFKNHKAIAILLPFVLLLALVIPLTSVYAGSSSVHKVTVPEEDRFEPFVMTIRSGEQVQWVNNDTDNHTIVSNDFFTTTNNKNTNVLLTGTDANNGKPGTYTLRFSKPGVFAYYCRFHSHLDSQHQPVAPGPEGGIKDAKGNFGTPMNGIVVVLPGSSSK